MRPLAATPTSKPYACLKHPLETETRLRLEKAAVPVAGDRLSRGENVWPRSYTMSPWPDGRLMRLPSPGMYMPALYEVAETGRENGRSDGVRGVSAVYKFMPVPR